MPASVKWVMSQPQTSRYPWMRIAALLFGGLVYGVSPIDIIPDLIPILGFADDVAVWVLILVYAFALRQRMKNTRKKEILAPVR